jgi:hypothetical protein
MTPEQFGERYAHYLVEPWGDEWQHTSAIVATIHNAATRNIYSKSRQRIPSKVWCEADQFVPKYVDDDERKAGRIYADQGAAEQIAARFGIASNGSNR